MTTEHMQCQKEDMKKNSSAQNMKNTNMTTNTNIKKHAEKLIHAHIAYVKVAHETIISLLSSVFHLRQDLILHWDWTKVSYLILSIME